MIMSLRVNLPFLAAFGPLSLLVLATMVDKCRFIRSYSLCCVVAGVKDDIENVSVPTPGFQRTRLSLSAPAGGAAI